MLVLTRRLNEVIQLGDDIRITVVAIDSDRVRIGIDAPRDLKIYRKELLEEVTNLNRQAAASVGALNLDFSVQTKENLLKEEKKG